jgi:tetratricopeptide (TPR) repeat protein
MAAAHCEPRAGRALDEKARFARPDRKRLAQAIERNRRVGYHRRVKLVVAALLLLVSSTVRADPVVEAKARFEKGTALYAIERWDEAIAEFEAGYLLQPLPSFLFNIAQAHRQAGRRERAVKYYQKYLELDPEASDRAEVEKLIVEQSAPPPEAPHPEPRLVPQVIVSPPPAKPAPGPLYRRWYVWTAVAFATILVVGLAVGIGTAESRVQSDFGTVVFHP